MAKPLASPMVAQAVERLVHALHGVYPEIETTGVRPAMPGLFSGHVAGQPVRLVPGKRNSRLFLMETKKHNRAYFSHGFDLFKKGVTLRWLSEEDETKLVLWLTNAALELESMRRD